MRAFDTAALHGVRHTRRTHARHCRAAAQVEKGEPGCRYAPKRSPAWCDRVLLKSALPHKCGSAAAYFSDAAICSSDHKPVGAVLALPLVTHTVASGRLTGRTPFKLYMSSAKLKGDGTWRRLADALATAQQAQRPRLLLVLSGSCIAAAKGEHVSGCCRGWRLGVMHACVAGRPGRMHLLSC